MATHTRKRSRIGAAVLAACFAACASPPPPPPPAPVAAVDLGRLGRLGILDFTAQGDASLEPTAREELVASVRRAQPGAVLLELGPPARVLASVGGTALDAETIRAIGRKYQLGALLVAELRADEMDPSLFMRRARESAAVVEIGGSLQLRVYDAAQGVPLSVASATGRHPITRVHVNAWGKKSVQPNHLVEVRRALVRDLVAQTTADFRPATAAPAPLATEATVPAKAAGRD